MEENNKNAAGEQEAVPTKERAPKKTPRLAIKNKKRLKTVIISVSLALVILIGTIVTVTVIGNRPPKLEEVRDRFEELVLASAEINEIYWGKGLSTYPRLYAEVFSFKDVYDPDPTENEKNISGFFQPTEDGRVIVAYHPWIYFIPEGQEGGIYYDFENNVTLSAKPDDKHYYRYAVREEEPRAGEAQNAYLAENLADVTEKTYYYYSLPEFDEYVFDYGAVAIGEYYDVVRQECKYKNTDEIKEAAAAVYSSAFLSSVNGTIFDGVATESGFILDARYIDWEDTEGTSGLILAKSNRKENKGLELVAWEYDFSTMRIVRKSNAKFVTVEIEREAKGKERETVKLYFARENGEWLLDAATY